MDLGETRTHLMQCMSTLWNNMRFLSRQPKAEAQGLQADGAVVFILCRVMT